MISRIYWRDGCFLLSKKGYASLEIVTQLRDKKCLYLIKQKFGGSVKLYSGDNYLRYRLHHKEGLSNLINKVNGLLQNPIRILQLGKICEFCLAPQLRRTGLNLCAIILALFYRRVVFGVTNNQRLSLAG